MTTKTRCLAGIAAAGVLLSAGCAKRFDVRTLTLDNGLRVVLTRVPSPVATAVVWLDYGEQDGAPGVARLANRLLLSGTEIRTRNQILREIEGVGGWIGVETGRTASILVLQAPGDQFAPCFSILCECLSRSTFDSTELAAASGPEADKTGGTINILRKKARSDSFARALLFPDSPAGAPDRPGKKPVSRDSVVAFAAARVRPERLIISLAGECDCKTALEVLRGAWRTRAVPAELPPFDSRTPVPSADRARTVRTGAKRDSLFAALRTSRPFGEEFLMEYLIGLAVSEKRDGLMAEAAGSGSAAERSEPDFYSQNEAVFGYWVAAAAVPAGAGSGLALRLNGFVDTVRKTGLPEPLFRTARRRFESALAIRSQYTLNHAYYGALRERLGLPYRSIFELQDRVASLTPAELNERARDILPRIRIWTSEAAGR
jgi:predicted Zn-dependent peptidase